MKKDGYCIIEDDHVYVESFHMRKCSNPSLLTQQLFDWHDMRMNFRDF